MADHSWHERRRESEGALLNTLGGLERVQRILHRLIGPIAGLRKATLEEDLNGVDYWADRSGARSLGVDLKCREDDYRDLLIEFVSNSASGSPGWTVNPKNTTDFVLYLMPTEEVLVSYPQLRAATLANLERWRVSYPEKADKTTTDAGKYRTHWIAVPDVVVYAAMGLRVTGQGSLFALERPAESGPRCPTCGGGALVAKEELFDSSFVTYTCGKRHHWTWRVA